MKKGIPDKKRIVLVHPRGFNWFPGHRDITDIANRMVPQGLLSIASYLSEKGHDVFVYDCLGPGVPFDLNEQVKAILDYQPQIVGFSLRTHYNRVRRRTRISFGRRSTSVLHRF
jgi:anaerobic magnesium-protoporphyrin IX monomethyl ester cyclase